MTTRLKTVADLAFDDALPESWVDAVMVDVDYLVIAGSDIACANTLNPTARFHRITGNTQLNTLTDALGAINGQVVELLFSGTPLISNSAGNIRLLAGSDKTVVANEIVRFVYDSAGAVWREARPAAPPAALVTLVADSKLAVDTASWDIQNIPGNPGDALDLAISMRCASTSDSAIIRLNNDSGANYDYGQLQAFNATVSNSYGLAQTSARLGAKIVGSSGAAGRASSVDLLMPDYAGTDYWKAWRAFSNGIHYDNTNDDADYMPGMWRNAAAVTRLAVLLESGGNIKAASRLGLWRRAIA